VEMGNVEMGNGELEIYLYSGKRTISATSNINILNSAPSDGWRTDRLTGCVLGDTPGICDRTNIHWPELVRIYVRSQRRHRYDLGMLPFVQVRQLVSGSLS